ncbi:MAG: 8-amino-7-oxononanoate synthase [Bacteroidota bacterium]|nr:8-amino-7-oxononanoate synthase [Bacteroidota bacterium]
MEALDNRIQDYIQKRKDDRLYRTLTLSQDLIDFSSNDYLGLSRSAFISQQVENDMRNYRFRKSGSTGSRLLNGNSLLFEEVEQLLAEAHHSEAALIFNSGFDANVGLISTVARTGDIIFYDEFVHASIHQGMRLSGAKLIPFLHNDPDDLENKLKSITGYNAGFLITESVFSMEGDKARLQEIAKLAFRYHLHLIIDEAHATGLFGEKGSGLCNEAGIEIDCFARVYTFGKAVGSHGGVIVGSESLKRYLVNFSKNFIYSTALETHNLLRVKHTYFMLQMDINQPYRLKKLNQYFITQAKLLKERFPVVGDGPIFGIIMPGIEQSVNMSIVLQHHHFDVRAILSPTVPAGTERLRIILHSYNTTEEIDQLIKIIVDNH